MNMFNFLDTLVKGSVYFLIDLLYSTGTLIAHPLSGSARLYRRDQNRSPAQISSTSFLAVTLILIGAVFAGDVGVERAAAANETATGLAAWLTTGTPPKGFGPILAGSVLAVALIVVMLRAIARLRGLKRRRCERFQAVMEYQLGLLFLAMALLYLWDMMMTEETKGGLPDLLILPLLDLAIVALGAHFWIGLLRIPHLHRLRRRLPRLRRRWSRRHYYRSIATTEGGRDAGRGGGLAVVLLIGLLIVLPLAAIPPVLVGATGLRVGWTATKWMLKQVDGEEASRSKARPGKAR